MYQIEIGNGKDLGCKYFFVPVVIEGVSEITYKEVRELAPMIDIMVCNVEMFLLYFLKKYFDPELVYNRRRLLYNDEKDMLVTKRASYNFYTYETVRKMIAEIAETADLLENDFEKAMQLPATKDYDIFLCMIRMKRCVWMNWET